MKHDRSFDPCYGQRVELFPGLCRLTAQNPGPFTFHGTNTYILGQKDLVIVDPGPASMDHVETILKVTNGARIEAILVTHTHVDHSPAARMLKKRTGAPVIGCEPHRAARPLMDGEVNPLDASGDKDYAADTEVADGEAFTAAGITFQTIATPGHTANHLCFAIDGEDVLISGDHVMAWSTSIVAAPDGSMRDYMTSIDKLLTRSETSYLPGHGGVVRDAPAYVEQLKQHRLGREASILAELGTKAQSIPEIVAKLYRDVDPSLHGAAGLSVFAHLEDLTERGRTEASPALAMDASFRLAG